MDELKRIEEGFAPLGPQEEGQRLFFDAVLHPHRSLSGRAFWLIMGAIGLYTLVFGGFFLSLGFWPIVGFLGLDVLAIYLAFKASYRGGLLREYVQLTDDALTVTRVFPGGRMKSWQFEPYWVRVEMDDPPEHTSQLSLVSHGRRLIFGAFLTPGERLEVAQSLRDALTSRDRALAAG
jgi:uncharacterized membrane protein